MALIDFCIVVDHKDPPVYLLLCSALLRVCDSAYAAATTSATTASASYCTLCFDTADLYFAADQLPPARATVIVPPF